MDFVIEFIPGPVTTRAIEVTGAAGCFIATEMLALAVSFDAQGLKKQLETSRTTETMTKQRRIGLVFITTIGIPPRPPLSMI
jgi:hypothetical protein